MTQTIKIAPLTRVEGHLDIEVTVDDSGKPAKVTAAKSAGTMFRGFENILKGRDPRDAPQLTQRICGVCPVSHGMAASLNLEAAGAIAPADNGRILRNLILGANFIASHVLHFYHLAALDYIDTTGILERGPWKPRFTSPDMISGSTAQTLVDHYVTALTIRRQAQQMGAIFGGRLPCPPTLVPGGCASSVTAAKISDFKALLQPLTDFINGTYIPDVQALASAFPDYAKIGRGCGNLLAYGVFDLDAQGATKLLSRGRYTGGSYQSVDTTQIAEYVNHSYYSSASGLAPANGDTTPLVDKAGAYSWIKAPRYTNKVHEVGPLARMAVNGDYRKGISVLDREMARALEAKKIAEAMPGWLGQLQTSQATQNANPTLTTATGIGLTEAPRGALGHWMHVTGGKIDRYQVITPTAWNGSPMDDQGQPGAIEQALVGTPVADLNQPIEILRVVHSFDPCLSCSVHLIKPNGQVKRVVVTE
jgi:hydrogenase large subunit